MSHSRRTSHKHVSHIGHLTGSQLISSQLIGVSHKRVSTTGHLIGASFIGMLLTEAILQGVSLIGVYLMGVQWVTPLKYDGT
jgi:uncharacterized protein YjbI with pentapeptide repeats